MQRPKAWNVVSAPLNDEQKLEAVQEFAEPLSTVALNLPYVIRSRLIFATAHLCRQANESRDEKPWVDDLPLDEEVYFRDAEDRCGSPWLRYTELKRRIGDR
jgi:hypothetical protein